MNNSYAAGEVSGDDRVGGLVGNTLGTGTVSDSFWDIENSGTEESDGGLGLTTDEMTGENASNNMDGFDFDGTWETVEEDDEDADEDGYPILQEISREEQIKAQNLYPAEEEDDEGKGGWWDIAGFKFTLLSSAVVIAMAIYKKKR